MFKDGLKNSIKNRNRKTFKQVVIILLALWFCFIFAHWWKTYRKTKTLVEKSYVSGISRLSKIYKTYDISVDPYDDLVWFGTDAGLVKYNRNSGDWRSYAYQDGLINETVAAVLTTKTAIWAGTWWGVNRLDRKTGKMKSLTEPLGLNSSRVFSLLSVNDNIWIGTDDGITIVDDSLNIIKNIYKEDGLKGRDIYSMQKIKSEIYVGQANGEIAVYNLVDSSWSQLVSPKKNRNIIIWDIISWDNKIVFATSSSGLWLYSKKDQTWEFMTPTSGFPSKGAYDLLVVKGELWAGTFYGIARYNKKIAAWINMSNDKDKINGLFSVTSIANDNGYVWYGQNDKGIGKFFYKNIDWYLYGALMTSDRAKAIMENSDGLYVGFGYLGYGVDLFNSKNLMQEKNISAIDGLEQSNISKIKDLGSIIGFCGFDGISFYNKKNKEWRFLGKSNKMILSEVNDVIIWDGYFLIATNSGLCKYNFKNGDFIDMSSKFKDRIYQFNINKNKLYACTYSNGIISLNINKSKINYKSIIPGKNIKDFEFLGDSIVYINNEQKIAISNINKAPINFKWAKTELPEDKKPLKQAVFSSIEIYKNKIIAGSKNNGLFIFSNTKTSRIDYKRGLINNEVISLEKSNKNLWIGMFGGVCKLPLTKLESF